MVRDGGADAGLGVLSAAKAMELDFIPVGEEEYDFVISAKFLELEHVKAFIDVLLNSKFHSRLKELGGYTSEKCGQVVHVG
jgi:putative molybdopterin biosynthesis protein